MLYDSFEAAGLQIPRGKSGDIKLACPRCQGERSHAHRNDRPVYLNVEKGTWRCYHCDWTGGLRTNEPRIFQPASRPPAQPPAPRYEQTHPDVLRWFAARGISAAVVERNRITGDRREIHFPFFRDGAHINTQYRRYDADDPTNQEIKDFRMDSGAERIFFGLDDVLGQDTWIITEGMIDKLAIEQATGFTNIVSVPNGAGTSLNNLIPVHADDLTGVKRFILAGDMDEKGRPFMAELARRLGRERCWNVTWPANDANATLMDFGDAVVAAALDEAMPEPIEGIVRLTDLKSRVLALRNGPSELGTPIMRGELGRLMRIGPGTLLTVSGVPGTGKSRFMDNVMVHTATEHGWRWGVCSPESWPLELHAKHLLQIYSGLPLHDLPGVGLKGMTERGIVDALDRLSRLITLVSPDVLDLSGILALMLKVVQSTGADGILLDPWNRLGHRTPNGMSMTNYVGQVLAELKGFAQRHNVCVAVVAHPRKPDAGREEDGGFVTIKPYDIADSHNFFDMSDFIVTLARNKLDLRAGTKVSSGKVKTEEYGRVGATTLYYDEYTGRMGDKPWR